MLSRPTLGQLQVWETRVGHGFETAPATESLSLGLIADFVKG